MKAIPDVETRCRRREWIPSALLCTTILLLLLSFIPPLVGFWRSQLASPAPGKALSEYTFVGDDYPSHYPHDLGAVSLTPANTVHYQIYTEDAEREWDSIFPDGGGFLLLGPQHRPFGLTLFHQMHCLVRIRQAMITGITTPHVHHCFNYLRQTVLCDADPALEPILQDAEGGIAIVEVPRMCRDWTKVYELVVRNYEETRERPRADSKATHRLYI